MQVLLIFLLELAVLLFLSKSLIRSISQAVFFLTKSKSATTSIIALIFFPGVVIHELSHMIIAGILFVRVGEIDLMPKVLEGGGVRLGSAMIAKTDILRRSIIGLAPLLVGLVVILGVPFLLRDQITFPYVLLIGYVLFEVGNTMFSSKKDLEGIIELVIVAAILVLTFYIANFKWPIDIFYSFINKESSIQFFKQVNFFMLWALGVDSISVLFFKLAEKFFNRHQTRI